MLKTNKPRFFKILEKASKPLKTLNKAKKHYDDCSEKKTRSSNPVNALVKHNGKSHEQNA